MVRWRSSPRCSGSPIGPAKRSPGRPGPNSRAFFGDVAKAFNTITDDSGPTGAAPALFVALLASIFAALAALAVWVELLIRSAGIYVCVLFFPVVLVARIWPKLEKWATRLAEALTALILSKFVIVAVLSVAAAAVADSRASEGFNGVLAAGRAARLRGLRAAGAVQVGAVR